MLCHRGGGHPFDWASSGRRGRHSRRQVLDHLQFAHNYRDNLKDQEEEGGFGFSVVVFVVVENFTSLCVAPRCIINLASWSKVALQRQHFLEARAALNSLRGETISSSSMSTTLNLLEKVKF